MGLARISFAAAALFAVATCRAGAALAPLGSDGRAEKWLVAGEWAGKAGFSVDGLGAENDIRPCEGDPVYYSAFDFGGWSCWRAVAFEPDAGYTVKEKGGNASWAKSTSYGALWVVADEVREADLAVRHGGVLTALFVNGAAIAPSGSKRLRDVKVKSKDVTDQGNVVETVSLEGWREDSFRVPLAKGANRLLVKLVRGDKGGGPVVFDAVFSGAEKGLSTATSDPDSDAEKHGALARMRLEVSVDAKANLPTPGSEVRASVSVTLPPKRRKKDPDPVLPAACPFAATLEQRIVDYDNREVRRVEFPIEVPGTNTVSYGVFPGQGHYTIHTVAKDADGRILFAFAPEGFGVLKEMKADARPLPRKLATADYWIPRKKGEGEREELFRWCERTGIRHNVGGGIGDTTIFEEAAERGVEITADFLDPWSNEKEERKRAGAASAAPYVRFFKSLNEIDINTTWRTSPERWTARTRLEHEIVKSVAPGAIYTGGSLVRTGTMEWFDECLTNGLYDCVDVWDVHAYPIGEPKFSDRHITNGPQESGPGVELCVRRTLGRENDKRFILGETGARCSHGLDARRWQADMVAKMSAWCFANTNYLRIAFLVPWRHSWGDIPVAHKPAEMALATVSDLCDGYPAAEVPGLPATVEARRFGRTTILWARGSKPVEVALPASEGATFELVDVIGRSRAVAPGAEGKIRLTLTGSPVYLVEKEKETTKALEPFPAGARVAFFGDSITRNGDAVTRTAAHYLAACPGRVVRVFNVGISGGGVEAGHLYFDGWLAPLRPTHVVLAFGVNDAGATIFKSDAEDRAAELARTDEAVRTFERRYGELIDRIEALGAKVVLRTPTPYDEFSGAEPLADGSSRAKPKSGRNDAHRRIADAVRRVAAKRGLPLVDDFAALSERLAAGEAIFWGDRVHPDLRGQWLLAKNLLAAQGLEIGAFRPLEDVAAEAGLTAWREAAGRLSDVLSAEWILVRDESLGLDAKLAKVRGWLEKNAEKEGVNQYVVRIARGYLDAKPREETLRAEEQSAFCAATAAGGRKWGASNRNSH